MFESSRDLLNIALAACAVTVTFFVAWLLWYFIKIIKDVEATARSIRESVEKFNHLLEFTKGKLADAVQLVSFLIKSGSSIADVVAKARDKKSSGQKSKQKET